MTLLIQAKVLVEMTFTHAAHQNPKICLCIMRDSPVALPHEVTDPAEGDDGEETCFSLWAHLAAVHKLPFCQHLHSQSCSL